MEEKQKKMEFCFVCEKPIVDETVHKCLFTSESMCRSCFEVQLRSMFNDVGSDALSKLRRRIEDHLRKSPGAVIWYGARLAAGGHIKFEDLI